MRPRAASAYDPSPKLWLGPGLRRRGLDRIGNRGVAVPREIRAEQFRRGGAHRTPGTATTTEITAVRAEQTEYAEHDRGCRRRSENAGREGGDQQRSGTVASRPRMAAPLNTSRRVWLGMEAGPRSDSSIIRGFVSSSTDLSRLRNGEKDDTEVEREVDGDRACLLVAWATGFGSCLPGSSTVGTPIVDGARRNPAARTTIADHRNHMIAALKA
jgi:hypothetical protein